MIVLFMIVVFIFIGALVLALPVMWLWNAALTPAVTVLNPIGFWQAAGINILIGILIKKEFSSSD